MKPGASAGRMPAKVSLAARASVTAGLANDVDDVAPVAIVLARSAIATFPPASCSPMMPEPTIVASRRAQPNASATSFLSNRCPVAVLTLSK
jgi:hypothetical protein